MTTIYYCMHGVHKIYVIITKYLFYESFKEEKENKNTAATCSYVLNFNKKWWRNWQQKKEKSISATARKWNII
jgi:hypothetical protein